MSKTAEMKALYPKFVDMIRAKAWHFAKAYAMDFAELEAHGRVIFCEAVYSFNPEKGATFSTHLGWQLMRINDYCYVENRNRKTYKPFPEGMEAIDDTKGAIQVNYPTLKEHMAKASDEVKEILDIVFEYEGKGRKPTYNTVETKLKARKSAKTTAIRKSWEEAAAWYAEYEKAEKDAICELI